MNGNSSLRSILTFLDESPSTTAAVELAVAWGKRFGALVTGLAVVDEPLLRGTNNSGTVPHTYQVAYDQLLTQARHSVEQRLDRFSRRCISEGVSYKLLEDVGVPGRQVLREAQRYDLLLVGRDANFGGGLGEESLRHFLRHTPRPIVATPPGAVATGPVLVAYDGSPEAARALHAFAASGLAALGDVHILSLSNESQVCAAKTADLAAEFLWFHEIDNVRLPIFGEKSPAKVILGHARDLRAGLIVMGACGQTRLHEYLLGSVTCTLLRDSGLPLFLYH